MTIGASRIGTAGWAIPSAQRGQFPGEGTHLERYARRFNAVEINSSFYRPHRRATYQRWAASVPTDFQFSVKVPKAITHGHRLADCDDLVSRFVDEVQGLGDKLGVLLVQLPPSLAFAEELLPVLDRLRHQLGKAIQCEPRHASWFTPHVAATLVRMGIGRVAADPPPVSAAEHPGEGGSLAYFRLHGAPRIYWSRYEHAALEAWSSAIFAEMAKDRETWVILDNTAAGFAIENAFELQALIGRRDFTASSVPLHGEQPD
ncbi:MAG: DUF72 domain-containing protein [Sphingobium sp.]